MALKIFKYFLVVLYFASCGGGGGGSSSKTLVLEKISEGTQFPIRIHELNSHTLIIAELVSGMLQKFDYEKKTTITIFNFPAADKNANGISGLLVDRDFDKNGFIYVYHYDSRLNKNILTRLSVKEDQVIDNKIIGFFESPSGHNGGGLTQDSDGSIYLGIGDGGTPELAQNIQSQRGKIVKIFNANGEATPRIDIFSTGLRNPFGISLLDQKVFAAENGPTCNDKILEVTENSQFSWNKNYDCSNDIPNQNGIRYIWEKSEGLTDLEAIESGYISGKNHGLLTARYNTNTLTFLELDSDKTTIMSEIELIIQSQEGPFIDIHYGKSGTVYVTSPSGVYRLIKD